LRRDAPNLHATIMNSAPLSTIVASGAYLPVREVTNAELTMFPPHSLPLIEQKTGIRARRYAADGQVTSDLAAEAGRDCLRRAGVSPDEVDAIIVATSSPDRLLSATAARVQHLLGASRAFAFDINSVCSGGVFAIEIADAWLRLGRCRRILVIAAEIYSRFLNPKDFSTYPYFGDGAGSVLMEQSAEARRGLLGSALFTDGAGYDLIQVPAGGSACPASRMKREADAYFTMRGRDVFEFATRRGPEAIRAALDKAEVAPEDVRWVVLHQANINIIDEIARRSGIPRSRFFVNLERLGNTAGASILIALHELREGSGILAGDIVVLAGFGGGLSWGAVVFRA
jgi:3-oxoacyl-[acyl-carrier-protein] synthase-3